MVAEGCSEATVLGICSSADESLMTSLMSLHGPEAVANDAAKPARVRDLRKAAGSAATRGGERRKRIAN